MVDLLNRNYGIALQYYGIEATSHQILRLIAFATCLIRLLGAAFSTLRLARYKEFVKQVGRTIRYSMKPMFSVSGIALRFH